MSIPAKRLNQILHRFSELEARLAAAEAAQSSTSSAHVSPAPSSEGQPVPAPVAGLVNINTAGAAELQTLPGVGPRAAERIIEHREEYGAFESVGGLAAVEGFDQDRVERILSRASV